MANSPRTPSTGGRSGLMVGGRKRMPSRPTNKPDETSTARQDTDLSVFRLQIGNQIGDVAHLSWYVALIGMRPDERLEARLVRHLGRGTPVELPTAVTEMLEARRAKDAGLAPCVERRLGRLTRAELYQRPDRKREENERGSVDR